MTHLHVIQLACLAENSICKSLSWVKLIYSIKDFQIIWVIRQEVRLIYSVTIPCRVKIHPLWHPEWVIRWTLVSLPQQGHALLTLGCHRAFKHNASQGGCVCVRLKNSAQMKAAAVARLIAFQKQITSPAFQALFPCTGEEAVFSVAAQGEEGVGGRRKVKQSYLRPPAQNDLEGTTHLSRDLSYNSVLSLCLSS